MENEKTKRGPGRPRKNPVPETTDPTLEIPPAVTSTSAYTRKGGAYKTDEEKDATLKRRRAREKKRELLGATTFGNDLVAPGDNARYLAHAMTIMEQDEIDITDPEAVEERIWWYFQHCVNSDMKPTVNGMCNALGIHRDTLHTWKTGECRAGTHQEIVLKAYRLMDELWENYMLNGKVNPVSGIFLGKCMFGYSDRQELVLIPNQGGINSVDAATIEAKYAELPDYES